MNPFDHRRRQVQRTFGTSPDEYGRDELQYIADGPLYSATTHFCPAGRLTHAQMLAREATQVLQ